MNNTNSTQNNGGNQRDNRENLSTIITVVCTVVTCIGSSTNTIVDILDKTTPPVPIIVIPILALPCPEHAHSVIVERTATPLSKPTLAKPRVEKHIIPVISTDIEHDPPSPCVVQQPASVPRPPVDTVLLSWEVDKLRDLFRNLEQADRRRDKRDALEDYYDFIVADERRYFLFKEIIRHARQNPKLRKINYRYEALQHLLTLVHRDGNHQDQDVQDLFLQYLEEQRGPSENVLKIDTVGRHLF